MKLRKKNKWIYSNKRKQFRTRATMSVTVIESRDGSERTVLVHSWLDLINRFM